jgi:hypothetical protein
LRSFSAGNEKMQGWVEVPLTRKISSQLSCWICIWVNVRPCELLT